MKSLKQLMQLENRKAIVSGGAGHIGLAISEALLELGATVLLLDVDAVGCSSQVESLGSLYGRSRVRSQVCDLADESATRQVMQSAIAELGGLGILVHSAAFVGTTRMPGWAVSFEEQTVDAWDAAMRISVTSAFVMAQEAKEALSASRHGSVILLSSIYGLVAPDMRLYEGTSMANPAAYGASKGGLLQLTRYLASILAPHVRVNAITPGGVWRNQPDAFHERYRQRTPLQRMATEEDVKGAVAYLATDLSAYVTGQNLVVDGGWTAW